MNKMREIKFKARELDTNEWIYGYFEKDKDIFSYGNSKPKTTYTINGYASYSTEEEKSIGNIVFDINPLTLCQFTGLKDRKGMDIYEHDFLDRDSDRYVVRWDDDECRFICVHYHSYDSNSPKKENIDLTRGFALDSKVVGNENIIPEDK